MIPITENNLTKALISGSSIYLNQGNIENRICDTDSVIDTDDKSGIHSCQTPVVKYRKLKYNWRPMKAIILIFNFLK